MINEFSFVIGDNKQRSLTVRWPTIFTIDAVLILLKDAEDKPIGFWIINSFLSETKPNTPIPKQLKKYKLNILGLQTVGNGKKVVCIGTQRVRVDATDIDMLMNLRQYVEPAFDIDFKSKKVMSVKLEKKPPSNYMVSQANPLVGISTTVVLITDGDDLYINISDSSFVDLSILSQYPPATWVACRLLCKSETTQFACSDVFEFETYLTDREVDYLYTLANKFKKTVGLRKITHMYRNKHRQYFDDIISNNKGIMKPQLKNNGGEQGSVINGNFHGLFFSTFLDIRTNKPQQYSYFGPWRLYVKAEVLFNRTSNLYFVDFYCHYKKHHVAIIISPSSSPKNEFCRKYLRQLDIFDNPFLCLQKNKKNKSPVIMACMDVIVEVYYTDTVDIKSTIDRKLGYFEHVDTVGRGYVLPWGVPKNSTCSKCNL